MKSCNSCNHYTDNFRQCKYSNGNTYHKSICRNCERSNAKIYASSHRQERYLYNKNNSDQIKEWKINNKDKINYQYKEKLDNDSEFKLRKNCSRAVSRMLKSNFSSKYKHSILQFLPYSMSDLKIHIENKFNDKMSWNNYGIYWEIDHIIPQSDLPYSSMSDDNFKICWSLNNLRPYEISLNRSDGAKRIRHNVII